MPKEDVQELIIKDDADLKNILNSKEKAIKVLDYYCNYFEKDYIYSKILQTQEEIYEYIIDKMQDNNIIIEEHIEIQKYISLLFEYLKNNPTFIYSNPIFNMDKNILLGFIKQEDYLSIVYIANDNIKKANDIYNKFIVDEDSISKDEFLFLIKFFINNMENDKVELDEKIKFLIYKVLNSKKEYTDDIIKIFILKYLTYQKSKEYVYKINVYLCDDVFKEKHANSLGFCDYNDVYINNAIFKKCLINKFAEFKDKSKLKKSNNLEEDSFYELIVTLYHEIAHCKQFFDEIDNKKTLEAIAEIENILFTKKFGYDEYKKNYNYYDTELIADVTAYNDIIMFAKTFLPDYYNEIKEKSIKEKEKIERKKSYSYKVDLDGNKYVKEYYIVESLNKIILNNPKILNHFEQLKEFYTEEGNLKSLDGLLLNRTNYFAKNYEYNIFDKFIIFYIQQGHLNKLDMLKYSDIERRDILLSLDTILINLVKDIYNIKNSYKEDDDLKTVMHSMIIKKVKLINYINKFIKNNSKEFSSFTESSNQSMNLLKNILIEFKIDFSSVSIDEIMNEPKIRNIK